MNLLFKTSGILSFVSLCAALLLVQPTVTNAATTETLNCSANYQIVKTLANQAKWEMCWEPRAGIGYKLTQVIFTPPNGIRRKIFGALHAAQLFVPYDDNGARYHDISYGVNMATLSATECPNGTLLTNSTLCLRNRPASFAFKNLARGASRSSDSFEVFGYYGIGNYYYTFKYAFFDDGSLEPSVLASGSLQRYGGGQLTGWPVGASYAVNHSHLVFWRMDFDLDGAANNLVEQIEFNGNGTDNRNMVVTPLTTETKTTNNLANGRFWRVRNTSQVNNDGRNISYEIEPSVTDQLRASESFTQNDFYLTQNRVGEDLVDSGLVSFVNGETITDAVLWYGVNFHHVPRGEDDVKMPAHTQGFRIRPRDMTTTAQVAVNNPPIITNPGNQTTSINTVVSLQINASDSNTADVLTYSASGLPLGLSINSSTGLISGTVSSSATSTTATITVSDGHPGGNVNTSFTWNVTRSPSTVQTFSASSNITIRDNATAQPYPVSFNVTGLSGTISKVTVSLNGLSHTYASDMDIILVGPGGQKSILMSDAGGNSSFNNGTITFDPSAATPIPTGQIASGVYKPANYDTSADNFPAPGPGSNTAFAADLSVFNGTSPNGTWNMFVVDDASADTGQIINGATLNLTIAGSVNTAPTVALTAPANNSTVSGNSVLVNATATDAEGVAGVQFLLDGANLGGEDISAPYSINWDSTSASNGSHTLTAKVRDTGGITVTSTPVTVNVNNTTLPDLVVTSMIYNNGYFTSTIKNQGGVATPTGVWVGVGYYVDGAYKTYGVAVRNLAPGQSAAILANAVPYIVPNGTHVIKAFVNDVNRFAESDTTNNQLSQTITVGSNDTTPPSVAITAPLNGASISGANVTLSANANDNVGVVGVQFKLDGSNLGAEVTTAPYNFVWNSLGTSNGNHTLTAVARDASGNSATSSSMTVNVDNSSAALPDVIVTNLSYSNGYFTSTVKNQGTAATPAGVWVGVSYYVDGAYKTYGVPIRNLAAGASAEILANLTAFNITSGSHTIKAHVDANNRFVEMDDTNNSLSSPISVP